MKYINLIFVLCVFCVQKSQSQACTISNYQTAFRIPPTSFPYFSIGSGITVSVQTNVSNYGNVTYNCGGLPYACSASAWGLTAATHYIRLTFSAPVTNLTFIVNGTNQTEVFYNASGTGAITLSDFCSPDFLSSAATLTDMVVPAVGSIFTLNNPIGSTTYTLTHNGLGAGSRVTLLDCFVPLNMLPIELASFKAECTNKDEAKLSWKIFGSKEKETLIVEKSNDGSNWHELTTYKADDLINKTEYSYLDNSTENQVRYYRLKMTESDGSYKYSQTILAGNCHKMKDELRIFPNPFKDQIQVSGNLKSEIHLYDGTGNLLKTTRTFNGRDAEFKINDLEKGIYIIRSGNLSKKLIKE